MREEVTKKKQNWFKKHPRWTVVIVVFVVLIFIAGAQGESEDKSASTQTNSTPAATETKTEEAKPAEEQKPAVPVEYTSALTQATSYANRMHMSKQGVYDQLISEYGGKFSPEAAQYAIDNVKVDWNAQALAKAKSYQSQQSMSPAAIHDQLTSEYGEKFTAAEADYAIANLNK